MTKLVWRPLALVCGSAALLLSGCVDDSYDLDNIDDSVQLKVDNLTIPLEFSEGVKFSDVVDLTDNDLVEVDAQGNYVLLKTGDFESELIEINEINATPNLESFRSEPLPIAGIAGQLLPIPAEVADYACFNFEFDYDMVDAYIRDISEAEVDFDITLKVSLGIPCVFSDLSFRLPSGMTGKVSGNHGEVQESGSIVTFKRVDAPRGEFEFKYHVTELDVRGAGGVFTPKGNGEYGVFHLENSIALTGGKIQTTTTASGSIQASFTLGTIRVNSISGSVRYSIDDFSESATLEGLPDLLTDKQTRLGLVNPQLYLRVHNPFGEYGAEASTGITLSQERASQSDFLPESCKSVSTSTPIEVTSAETQMFLLAASKPEHIYEAYAGVVWNPKYALPGMGNIIYGQGMPDRLQFAFSNPTLDSDAVSNFPIGRPVGRVYGDYAFYAPLDFSTGSQVVYTQEQSGWDLQDFVVNSVDITTDVTSEIPVDVQLSVVPLVIGEDGELTEDRDVVVTPVSIPAKASGKTVTLKVSGGNICHLDGMRYTVTLLANGQGGSFGPETSLDLKNLKVTVSGYYNSKK